MVETNANFIDLETTVDSADSAEVLIPNFNYRTWSSEKRRASGRERTRKCRARRAELQSAQPVDAAQTLHVGLKFPVTGQRQAQRTSATLAREIGFFVANKIKNHDVEVQHLTVSKLLAQPILQEMVPPFLRDPAAVKLRHEVLGSLRSGMQSHLVGLRKARTVQAKNIVTTFAVAPGVGSGRGVAEILGVDRRNIKKALARRILIDNKEDAFWLQDQRRVRCDALPDVVKNIIRKWWEEETTISPNRKDIVRKWVAPKLYIEHATHYLQVSQVTLQFQIQLQSPFVIEVYGF